MESVKPKTYGVKGPEIPYLYNGTAIRKTCKSEEKSPLRGAPEILKGVDLEDLLLIGLMLLLLDEKNNDNYIMLAVLAILLFD